VQIDPAELLGLMHNDYIDLRLIDVRDERDWNLFHLWGAERIPTEALVAQHERFMHLHSNAVIVLMGNDEAEATAAWQLLMATANRPNAYILAGGINRWLNEYAGGKHGEGPEDRKTDEPDETLRYPLKWALGSRHPAALPDLHEAPDDDRIVKKVRLQKRVVRKGGCG
jgi:rhodanese-related sulfurtransferase